MKHNQKLTATPPSTFKAAADNHFLPPLNENDDNDAKPDNLMGRYNVRGKNKGKGGHHCRYRDKNETEALHGLYKVPKDDDNRSRGDDDAGGDWDNMKEKEQGEKYDGNNGVVDITAVQIFSMTDKVFLDK